jgi:hypothetical protein
MSKLDVAKEEIAYLKLWLGIVIVTDISLMGWLLGNFQSAGWALILGDIVALICASSGCYSLHTRIKSAIAKLEEL